MIRTIVSGGIIKKNSETLRKLVVRVQLYVIKVILVLQKVVGVLVLLCQFYLLTPGQIVGICSDREQHPLSHRRIINLYYHNIVVTTRGVFRGHL